MDELGFTLELNTDLGDKQMEARLMRQAEDRLRPLTKGHTDLTGAAVNIRHPGGRGDPPLYEATVVAYIRPEHIAATEKADSPEGALRGALKATERQIRSKRERLREQRDEQAFPDPAVKELIDVEAAERRSDEIAEMLEEEEQ